MSFEKKKFQSESLFDVASKRYAQQKVHEPQAGSKFGDKEYDDLINLWKQLKEKYQEIELRLENLFRFSQVTPQALSKFLANPKNFSKEDWDKIQLGREESAKRIEELCHSLPSGGQEALQRYLQGVSVGPKEEPQASSTSPESSQLKKKKLLPRRRWLNMH